MNDRIAKQRLNVIILIDCSKSMQGERIAQANGALRDIKNQLAEMQDENSNADFYLTVITFSNGVRLLNGDKMKAVRDFVFTDICAGGRSNLHTAYIQLADLLKKESSGGIMPDFGGVAPIILLMTDGHPTKWPMTKEMAALKKLPWFNAALKYGIAVELNDKRTTDCLKDFVSGNGDVIECYNASLLKHIIRIIVLTASKVKPRPGSVHAGGAQSAADEVKQEVRRALSETDNWEW